MITGPKSSHTDKEIKRILDQLEEGRGSAEDIRQALMKVLIVIGYNTEV